MNKLIPIEVPVNIDIEPLKQNMSVPSQFKIDTPEIPRLDNPIHETNKILESQNEKIDDLSNKLEKANLEISKQTKELQSIHYKNMKLNAQVEVLNRTIDTQNNELERLRNINIDLNYTNQILKDNNNHYWRNTFIVGFIVALIFFLLGLIIP